MQKIQVFIMLLLFNNNKYEFPIGVIKIQIDKENYFNKIKKQFRKLHIIIIIL